ncbi:transposase [Flavilitoribacter nigricans]|uniref:Transposase n=1 Tax=Flavilitoribacter nigricans (strain ATCC 23147 / DSM 23189 / NBRC 102662 / NCIMB 1420 / SS-2) TaxID=1122177 RepID=A0A2D0NAF5_FLAN2|nr:transposase [Flavilitoribacter nigricans]PHN05467.1 transposase [Flavilitoribacter nigricans DSM 23189 = NBRC 102662]
MANSYTQIYLQVVFAVSGRQNLIKQSWKDELYKYMTTVVMNNGHYLLAINGMPDHIHLFFRYRQTETIPKLISEVKTSSSHFIKKRGFTPHAFNWQGGYGAFSYSQSQVSRVINYIERQEVHHRKQSFREEYKSLLESFEIAYRDEYLFDFDDVYRWE